ncbi:hypothetical protein R1sor_016102 [Riccia sorocarpa]|uniref:Uncharacterized protein n=1 Tax=Riccia sorocarpa TaxID=122646 RepID=A0ABD3HE11_9MARC
MRLQYGMGCGNLVIQRGITRKLQVSLVMIRSDGNSHLPDTFGWRLMDTGCVFAYTRDGCLKEEFLQYEMDMAQDDEKQVLYMFCASGWHCPIERSKYSNECEDCEGHVSRKSVKECWHKCGYSMGCGNRVIQRGITCKLQIFFTHEGKGWGLRTLEQLHAGAFCVRMRRGDTD